jgi:hypothetical protein
VTKDATVAEMAADGTMTVLVKGTNEWVCTPGNENKIGDPPMCMNPMGYAMDDGCHARKAEAHEHRARNGLHAVPRHTEKQHQSGGQNQSGHSNRTALEDHMAFRCCGKWTSHHGSRERRLGDVAGTLYAYLHVCGTPWDGNEYHEGNKAVWTMSYARH